MSNLLEHVLGQNRRRRRRALGRAGGTQLPRLAREGEQVLLSAIRTPDAGEAVLIKTAVEVPPNLLIDKPPPEPKPALKTLLPLPPGDIHCLDGDLEGSQRDLAEVVGQVLSLGLFPVVLGGGPDLAFGHYLGISHHRPRSERLGILNFDAHLDLRSLRSAATSGTMFSQIAAECRARESTFSYFCVGTQKSANTVNLFRTADELGVETVLAKDIDDADLAPVKKKLDGFLAGNDVIYTTICADVFSSAFAPGVSAPQPFGLHPETVLRLFKHVLASKKIVSFDFAEVSPRFDNDDNTAKLAAVFIFALVDTLGDAEVETI